jgi:hypothetical protein
VIKRRVIDDVKHGNPRCKRKHMEGATTVVIRACAFKLIKSHLRVVI